MNGSSHVTTNASGAAAAAIAATSSINNGAHSMVNATNSAFDNADIIKYRFGPLIWRTSKERRKTKHHRRDKCNSGDSGIQVELENDENLPHDMIDSLDASPSAFNVRVRRANSAKVGASNPMALMARARILKRNDSNIDKPYLTSSIPGRSLSQPYGLNQIAPCKYRIRLHRHTALARARELPFVTQPFSCLPLSPSLSLSLLRYFHFRFHFTISFSFDFNRLCTILLLFHQQWHTQTVNTCFYQNFY